MKHKVYRLVMVLVASVMFSTVPALAQDKKVLSLQEAIDLSLKNSGRLKISQARIEEATAAYKEAAERRLPEAGASASYLQLSNPNVNLKLKTDNSNGGSGSGEPVKVSQAGYGMINASLPLFSGFRIKYGMESARYLEQAAKLDAEKDREEVTINTIDAFNNLYKAKAAASLVKENLAQARQRVKDFAGLEKNGLLARNDYLKTELQASNIELSLLDAENNWKMANINMNLMLGLPENTELLPDSSSLQQATSVKSIEDYLQLGLQNRKDLSSLSYRKKAAEAVIKAAEGEKYPSLALTGGYLALNVPHALTIFNAANIGVGVQYSISSLWKTKSKVQQAIAREKQVEANEGMLTDAIRLQINQAYQNYLLGQKKIEVYAKAVTQATENYKIVKNKYDNGLATVTDLLDADIAQLQTKLNHAFAQSDATVAYNKLLQAAGGL